MQKVSCVFVGLVTDLSFFTKTKDDSFNWLKVCERSIPMNPRMVASFSSVLFFPALILKVGLWRKKAILLSCCFGKTFSTPRRSCPKNAVSYAAGSHPCDRNKYFTWPSFPRIVDALAINGHVTKSAMKNERYNSVLLKLLGMNGEIAPSSLVSSTNRRYARYPVL